MLTSNSDGDDIKFKNGCNQSMISKSFKILFKSFKTNNFHRLRYRGNQSKMSFGNFTTFDPKTEREITEIFD